MAKKKKKVYEVVAEDGKHCIRRTEDGVVLARHNDKASAVHQAKGLEARASR